MVIMALGLPDPEVVRGDGKGNAPLGGGLLRVCDVGHVVMRGVGRGGFGGGRRILSC